MRNESDSRLPSEHDYHGIFAKLAALDVYDNTSSDIYGPELSEFYSRLLGNFVGDIPIFERLLHNQASKVLDLACGSGRIGISLARAGFCVDGLDLSPDMLARVNVQLETESEEVKSRLHFVQGDMTSFTLPCQYDLITLGVTSISLLLTTEQRNSLFNRVRVHLKPGGRFIFDFLNLSGDRWKQHDNYLDVWSSETNDGVDFGIIGQKFYPDRKLFTFNVYREVVGWDGTTKRSIGTSTKAWLCEEELVEAMARAGLRIVERLDVGDETYLISGLNEGA